MNNSGPWTHDFICYENLKVTIDTNNSVSWPHGSKCYEQLKAIDDMSYSWL